MKTLAFVTALTLAATIVPATSDAAWTPQGGDTIVWVRQDASGHDGGNTLVKLTSHTCTSGATYFYVRPDRDPDGRMHKMLVAAHLAGRKVRLGFNAADTSGAMSGKCQVYSVELE